MLCVCVCVVCSQQSHASCCACAGAYVCIIVVLLRLVAPLRVSPSWGIVREVAHILLRLGEIGLVFEIGGSGGGADEMGGVDGLVTAVFNGECLVAGLTIEIEPAILTLPLLGFLAVTVMKSLSRAPKFAFFPLWSNTFRSSNAAKLFCIFIGGLDNNAGVNDEI